MLLFYSQFVRSLIIEVESINESLNIYMNRIALEDEKWEVHLKSFDLIEMKDRIQPCEFIIKNEPDGNHKMLVHIDNSNHILKGGLLFNLIILPLPCYDFKTKFRSCTYKLKELSVGEFEMIYIPTAIISFLIHTNLIYRNLTKVKNLDIVDSNFKLNKSFVRSCIFYNSEHLNIAQYWLEHDYQDFVMYILRVFANNYNFNLHLDHFSSLINNIFSRYGSGICEIFDVIKDEIVLVVPIIYESSRPHSQINDKILNLIGLNTSFRCKKN